MNRKSQAFVTESLMRIEAECVRPVIWYGQTGGRVPDRWKKERVAEELVAACEAFKAIQALAQGAIREFKFHGSGVFPAGAQQGELVVDNHPADSVK